MQMLKKRAVVSVPVVEEVRPEAWWSCVMMTMNVEESVGDEEVFGKFCVTGKPM